MLQLFIRLAEFTQFNESFHLGKESLLGQIDLYYEKLCLPISNQSSVNENRKCQKTRKQF